MQMNVRFRTASAVLVSLCWLPAAASVSAQSVLWPDTVAPCNTSLQACLDGLPEGMYVQIAMDDPGSLIAGASSQLVLSKTVSVVAAPGYRPIFPSGLSIRGNFSEPVHIGLAGIGLRNGGVQLIGNHVAGTSHFHVERMDLIDGSGGNGISIEQLAGGRTEAMVTESRYRRNGGAGNALRLRAAAGELDATVSYNQVRITDSDSSAYGMHAYSENAGIYTVRFHGNRVQGAFSYGAICVLAAAGDGGLLSGNALLQSNVLISGPNGGGNGICVFAGENTLAVDIDHNTMIGYNTALRHVVRPFSPPASVGTIAGSVTSNLLAHNQTGWRRDTIAATVGNAANLFFGHDTNVAGTDPPTLAPSTVIADPRLRWREYPYLRGDSPAIDAAAPALPALANDLAAVDAAGSRRHKGVARDIGAYEYGDLWLPPARADAGNTQENWFYVEHESLNTQPAARLLATPYFTGAATNTRPFGVWYDSFVQRWSVFNQDISPMPIGAGYQAFVPAVGPGNFLHQTPASGFIGSETLLDDPSVNGNPDAIIVATQNWNPSGSAGVYNDAVISIRGYADNNWRIRSNQSSIPNAASFNVYAQDASPSAFVHHVNEFNRGGDSSRIDHPLLDGVSCARLQVALRGNVDDREFDIFYGDGHWRIFTPFGSLDGASFNVVFSSEQVFECSDRLFANGFEND